MEFHSVPKQEENIHHNNIACDMKRTEVNFPGCSHILENYSNVILRFFHKINYCTGLNIYQLITQTEKNPFQFVFYLKEMGLHEKSGNE